MPLVFSMHPIFIIFISHEPTEHLLIIMNFEHI
jgi:hypothetical protein